LVTIPKSLYQLYVYYTEMKNRPKKKNIEPEKASDLEESEELEKHSVTEESQELEKLKKERAHIFEFYPLGIKGKNIDQYTRELLEREETRDRHFDGCTIIQ